MRHNRFGFIGLMMLGMCLASCSFVDVLAKKLKSIVISCSNTTYIVNETFDKDTLSFTAKNTDGKAVTLTKNDVTYNLKLNNTACNIDEPFTTQGTYYLTVSKDDVTSNKLTIRVFESEQYISNISISGKSEIEIGKEFNLSLSISPTYYTVPIEYTVSDSSIISITKQNDKTYTVKGLNLGTATVTFRAQSGEGDNYTSASHTITVSDSKKVEMSQTYQELIRSHSYAYDVSSCPTTGNVKLLVIPIWFTDSSNFITESKKSTVKSNINTVFFGTESGTGWHSVSSYYYEESRGALNLTGTVTDWYNAGVSATTVNNYSQEQQNNLILTATDYYFTNNPSDDRTSYDSDHDGYLDGVMVIYGAPDYSSYSSFGGTMWAYCFWIQDKTARDVTNPAVNAFFWASYDFIYGSNNASTYTGRNYHSGDTKHCTFDGHTFIHEMGHMFGLEDYYDYSKVSSPTAGFSMQDNNVGGHDPYSAMALKWAKPYIPVASETITINDFQSSGDMILLTPSWNEYDSVFDEYLLLELYSPTGLNEFDSMYQYSPSSLYPQGPGAIGIRVWHVDTRLIQAYGNTFFSDVNKSSVNGNGVAFNNTYYHYGEVQDSSKCRNSFAYEPNQGSQGSASKIDYQRINALTLIRKSTTAQYINDSNLSSNDLFVAGNSFDMTTYSKQFYYNNAKLDSGLDLGWSFAIESITSITSTTYSATISLTRL